MFGSTLSCLKGKWPIQNTVIVTCLKYMAGSIGLSSITFTQSESASNLDHWHIDQNQVSKMGGMWKKMNSGLTGFSTDTGGKLNCPPMLIYYLIWIPHFNNKLTNMSTVMNYNFTGSSCSFVNRYLQPTKLVEIFSKFQLLLGFDVHVIFTDE